MCQMKSMILLKDSVFCPDYDGHSDMLEALKIKDNKRVPDFVKIEILPPCGDWTKPIDQWSYEPDQDAFPKWYVQEVDEPRCREALKVWADGHILRNAKCDIGKSGIYYVCEKSDVTAWDSSTVTAWDSSKVTARGNSKVTAWGNSTVMAWGNSTVTAWDSSTVTAWDSSKVTELHDRAVAIKRRTYYSKPEVLVFDECN